MRRLDNSDLLHEYYNQVKHQYPDLSFEDFREVVTSPFNMLKEDMKAGKLSTVRLKYLGTFLVYKNRAKGLLKSLTDRFKMHKIDKKEYFDIKKMIDEYLEKN